MVLREKSRKAVQTKAPFRSTLSVIALPKWLEPILLTNLSKAYSSILDISICIKNELDVKVTGNFDEIVVNNLSFTCDCSEVHLAVAAHISDKLVDRAIDSLMKCHKELVRLSKFYFALYANCYAITALIVIG